MEQGWNKWDYKEAREEGRKTVPRSPQHCASAISPRDAISQSASSTVVHGHGGMVTFQMTAFGLFEAFSSFLNVPYLSLWPIFVHLRLLATLNSGSVQLIKVYNKEILTDVHGFIKFASCKVCNTL